MNKNQKEVRKRISAKKRKVNRRLATYQKAKKKGDILSLGIYEEALSMIYKEGTKQRTSYFKYNPKLQAWQLQVPLNLNSQSLADVEKIINMIEGTDAPYTAEKNMKFKSKAQEEGYKLAKENNKLNIKLQEKYKNADEDLKEYMEATMRNIYDIYASKSKDGKFLHDSKDITELANRLMDDLEEVNKLNKSQLKELKNRLDQELEDASDEFLKIDVDEYKKLANGVDIFGDL